MAIKTIRVFAEYTSDGYVPMPSQGNIDYGITIGNSFPETQPSSYQTDDPNIDVAVNTMTDFYVWIRTHGSPWNPSYTRVVRVYPDSPSINSVVMNMIVAVGGGGTTISSGGGVNYYLNGGTSQGVLDGSTYYEMSKTPVEGAGVDFFKIHTTGYENIAQFVTDAGDPALLNIPGGNWPIGFYFSASDNSGNPKFYAEIYKYSAAGVFTLLGTGSANPEVISNGMAIDFYTTNVAVPDTTLVITDRIAVRIFVNTDGNRTVNLHTQDSHLSTVGTTFTRGLTAINGLIKQVQFIAIGNAGSDAAIVSSDDTHTINLPTASASKRGLLNGTDWSTFNAKQAALSGDGFVKISGSTISYDNSTYLKIADTDAVYQKLNNLSSDLTASASKYPSVNAVIAGLATKQPLDSDLTAIAALSGDQGILKKTGVDTWVFDTTAYLTASDAASTYQLLSNLQNSLAASTSKYPTVTAVNTGLATKQPLDADLTAISNLDGDVGLLKKTAANTWTLDTNTYIIAGDVAATYQRLDNLSANLTASTTKYPSVNAVNAGLDTKQPLSADLTSIATLGTTTGLVRKTNDHVFELDTNEYLTIASLSGYQTTANLSSNLTASSTKYPSVNAVNTGLATKLNLSGGTLTGDLTLGYSIPTIILNDTSSGIIFKIINDSGTFKLVYGTTTPLAISTGGAITATSFIKDGGTAAQFLKANGSVDSNTYATTTALADYLTSATAATLYQSKSNDLTAIDALALTTGLLRKNGADTWELDQNTYLTSADLSGYQLVSNLSTNLTSSASKYPSVNAVNTGLALRLALAGGTMTGALTLGYSVPTINLNDTDTGTIYRLINDGGTFKLNYLNTNIVSISTTGGITATSLIKSGGTSSQFLKADGSIDSNSYALSSALSSYLPLTGGTMSGGFSITNANNTYSVPSSTNVPNIYIYNSNSSSTTAHSILTLRTNLGTGGNPFVVWDISGVTGYSMGIDNADSDKLKIAATWNNVATSTMLTFTTAGAATFASTISASNFSGSSSGTNTGDQDLSGYLPLSGGTLTGRLTINVTNNYGVLMNRPAVSNYIGLLYSTTSVGSNWFVGLRETGTSNYIIYNESLGTDALTITSNNSNVLIGTNTNSGFKLDVNGTGRFSGDLNAGNGTTSVSLAINRGAAGNSNGLRFQTAGTNNWYIGSGATGANTNLEIYNHNTATTNLLLNYSTGAANFSSSVTATALYIGSLSNEQLMISGTGSRGIGVSTITSGDPYFRFYNNTTIVGDIWWGRSGNYQGINSLGAGSITAINPFGGNVGIGTTTPGYKLHVAGSGAFTGIYVSNADTSGSFNRSSIEISSNQISLAFTSWGQGSVRAGTAWVQTVTNHPIIFGTNDTETMRIFGTQLLIGGIASSSSMVEINGGSVSYGGGNGHLKVTSGATGQTVLNISNSSAGRSWEFAVGGSASGIGSGVFYIYDNTAGGERMKISTSGATTFGNSVTASSFFESSDSRLKELLEDDVNVKNIENLKAKLYIKNGRKEYGYFAQEAQSYMPSVVTTNEDGYLNLSYREVHTVKIARLEKRVAELEKQLNVA